MKTGYHFVNWTGTKTTASFKMPASNVSMTANGKANTYTVTYNCNGGTGSTSSSAHTYDAAKTLTTNGCEKPNYIFDGWNTKKDGSGTNYSNKASVSNLTATHNGTVSLYAQWELADSENPTCTITATSSGVTLNVYDDREVHSYDLTNSATATYNKKNTATLGAKTYYGYVKDAVGKTGSCSVTIRNATADKYTCSKSAYTTSTVNCNTEAKYNSPSTQCPSGSTYSSNSCSRTNLWSADKSGCGRKYAWSGTCQCWYYPGGSKTSKSCTASTCAATCSGYNYSSGSCEQKAVGYQWSSGTEYGLTSCTEYIFTCDEAHVGQMKIANCRKLGTYSYSGSITCYKYSCSEGTKDGTKCYKYNQTSCASGWTKTVSSYKCSSGTLISGTTYCK